MDKAIWNWHAKGNRGKAYTSKTQKVHTRYMAQWTTNTGLSPDELAAVDDISYYRGVIAAYYEGKVRIETVIHRLTALNAFWRANGRVIEKGREFDGLDKNTRENVFKKRGGVSKPKKTEKIENSENNVSKD